MSSAIIKFRFLRASHHRFWLAVAVIIAALIFPTYAIAQSSINDSASNTNNLVALNMRDADIHALIQWIAEQTHKQIVIDPRVQGRVSAYADKPMTIAQAYQVFLALLEVYGYSSSEIDGILRIYPSALAKTSPSAVVDDFNRLDNSTQVAYVLEVKNVASAALAQIIKPLLSASGYIASFDSSNSLIVADNGDNVKRLVELARRLDRSGSLDIDVIKLKNSNARDMAQILSSLIKPSGTTQGTSNETNSALSIAADERSNSILLAGEPSNRQRAQQLIAQIDQPMTASAHSSRVVFLHYLSAEELLPILKGITANTQKEAKEETVKSAAVSIEASKSNNAIVMSGPPDLLDNLRDIITKLDVQHPQVLVEAIIVEVSTDVADDLGVAWSTTDLGDLKGSGAVGAVNTLGQLAPFAADADGKIAGPAGGLTLGYYTGGSLQAAIRALSTNSKANILSTPSVLTIENQEAQIIVGSNIPLITGQNTSDSSSTSNPFTTYERKDIGVTLKITPQINANKSVTLNILQEIETVAPTANTALAGANDLVTNKRSITTKVLVADDKTLVLGGLISNGSQDAESKVPILGDMPLIGGLFRSTHRQNTKQNLLVFIHPVVVESDTTANKISRNQYEEIRTQQMKYENGKLEASGSPKLPEFEKISPQKDASDAPVQNH